MNNQAAWQFAQGHVGQDKPLDGLLILKRPSEEVTKANVKTHVLLQKKIHVKSSELLALVNGVQQSNLQE